MLLALIFGSKAKSIYFNYKDSVIIAMEMFFNRVIQTHQRKSKNSVLTLSIYTFFKWQLFPGGYFRPPSTIYAWVKGCARSYWGWYGAHPKQYLRSMEWGGGNQLRPCSLERSSQICDVIIEHPQWLDCQTKVQVINK